MSAPQFGEMAEPGPGDYCYRHGDRASFTLCQRCGRTICHECQIASPVGVLCADCARATQPAAVQRAGRSSRAMARRLGDPDTPIITYGLMLACVVVFAAQWIGAQFGVGVTQALWYAPAHSVPPSISSVHFSDVGFEPWRMLTVMFTHSTGFVFHILFNMYALWLFGPGLERMLGRLWFLLLYVFAGIGGSLAVMIWVYFAPQPLTEMFTPTVGASGAIFGLFAATLVALRVARVNATSLVVLIGINFAIGFMPGASISWQAHLGGMLIGALVMWAMLATRGPRRARLRVWSVVGIAAGLVALSLLYFAAMPISFG